MTLRSAIRPLTWVTVASLLLLSLGRLGLLDAGRLGIDRVALVEATVTLERM